MGTTAAFDILGFGTIAVDDTIYVERYPPPDQKARIHREGRSLGGQVATALAAASQLGARCAYGAMLGDGELSVVARNGLGAAGVDCRFVRQAPQAGPIHSVIIVDEAAKTRNIFFDIRHVTPFPTEAVREEMIAGARVLLLDQLGPDTVISAARFARSLGAPVVMDMEWVDTSRIDEMIALADHLLVPYDFAAAYTSRSRPADMVAELHRCARACTAVTCGRDGCYFLPAAGAADVLHLPALRVETVETTGCGDVFHGAYAAALASGNDVVECLRFASAAAAAFATRPSGWQYLPTASDVAGLLSSTD